MSSSFGGSGGSGSSGTIRYQIIIDDSQVNSKLSNIERSLQGLNSATQSTGSGLMNLNRSVQTLGSTTASTATDLDAINSNWQSMSQGSQNAANGVDAVSNSMKSVSGGITNADGKLKNWNSSVENAGQANKSFGSTLKDNALSITLTASGIVGLVSNFTQLEKAQVMANRASVMNEKAQRTLSNAQAKVNQLIAEGKKGTPEYAKAVRDLNIAQDSAKVAADRMRIAIQTFNERTASFLPQMAQDLIFVGGGITNMVSGLKDLKGLNLKGTFQGIGAAISGIGAPLAIAIAGIYALLFALKAASNLTDIAKEKFGKAYVEMSTGYAALIRIKQAFHISTKEEDAALAQLDKQMSSNAITADDYTKAVTDAALNPLPKSVENLINKLVNLKPPMVDATEGTDDYTIANDALTGSNEDLTVATLDQTKAESELNDERVATMKSIKGAGDLYEYYRKTGNQAAITTDKLGNVTDAFGNKLGNTYDNLKTFGLGIQNDLVKNMEDAGNKAVQFRNDFDKAWRDFGQQSFDSISKAFGDESKIDKMLKKFKKFTGKKIDLFVDMKVKDQDIKQLASTVISGLDDYMTSDKKADEVGKDLIKMINSQFKKGKTPKGAKDIIAYIDWAISQPNTKELLDKLGLAIKNGEPIPVPLVGKVTGITSGNDSSGGAGSVSIENELTGNADKFVLGSATKPVGTVPVSAKIVKIDDIPGTGGGAGGDIPGMQGNTVTKFISFGDGKGNDPGAGFAKFLKIMIQAANKAFKQIGANFDTMVIAKIDSGSNALAHQWSTYMNSFMKNASAAGNGIYKNLHSGFQKVADNSDDLAKHWSAVMNSFIKNAASAAKGVNAQLAKIKDVDVTITTHHIDVNGKAQGGLMSAASGKFFTTNGPQTVVVGDNPGGRETVAFIPHNNPEPTLAKIANMFGGKSNGGGTMNQTITLHISGNDLINERSLSKKIRLELGKNRDRFS